MNPRHKKAIEFYLRGYNKTDATEKAGLSRSSMKDVFYRHDVVEEIERRLKMAEKQTDYTKQWLINRLGKIIDAEMGDVVEFDEEGNVLNVDWSKMNSKLKSAIKHVEVTETRGAKKYSKTKRNVKVTTHDTIAASNTLMKLMGWGQENVQISGEMDLINRIQKGLKRSGDDETKADE